MWINISYTIPERPGEAAHRNGAAQVQVLQQGLHFKLRFNNGKGYGSPFVTSGILYLDFWTGMNSVASKLNTFK